MCETAVTFGPADADSRYFPALLQRLSILILLLAVAMITTSCGTSAQAAATQNVAEGGLKLSQNLPKGAINETYNAVIAVSGGKSPYHFSVRTGALPPGVHLNASTGTLSGKPTSTGTFTFEIVVNDAPGSERGSHGFALGISTAGGTGTGGGSGTVIVKISPTSAILLSAQTKQFTATVSGTSNTAVTWSATAGSVNATGLYTAPTVTAQGTATVTATSNADPTKSASAAVTVNPVNNQALQITTGGLPAGEQGASYSASFSATGGTEPYSWSVSAGAPPAGVVLSANGDLSGMPTSSGTFSFTVTVADSTGATANGNFSVTVTAGGNFDGPAELPRVTVPTAMADTPAPGNVVNVNAGADLQAAMNNANCGDTLQLQAGATFSGKFIVPAKSCDNSHWIIIRTSSPDSALPPEGQRATPCYAGVASLVGRPSFNCSNPKNVMVKVQISTKGDGPFQLAPGANFYRFIGLEVTRPVGAPGPARLISGQGTLDHIIVDRSWLHGQPQDETHAGVNLDGATYTAVIDSYLNDFHCISKSGACVDSHAVAGGVSFTQDGPFKIQDNFLEASGEAVMFGGGPANLTPTDIQILGNHFWKPWQWMPGNPNFVGGADGNPFVVKNHLELKNAVRVLVEANLMENDWGGFSQSGYSILLTPKNQHVVQTGGDVCPLCQVTDVTIRYVHASHSGGGIQMATALSGDGKDGAPALAGTRWSIHDVLLDDLSKKYVGGGTVFLLLNAWPKNGLNTVTINHVTGFPDSDGHMMLIGDVGGNAPMYGLVFTNNMIVTGAHPIWNTGGATSCSFKDIPLSTVTKCFATFTFSNNALVAPPAAYPPSTWPANNMFPQTIPVVNFVNYNNGNDGNYELQAASPYKNKGTDGKDLGADIVGLNAALANVE
jgi:hypothetical protein